jgi:hypothetical protein
MIRVSPASSSSAWRSSLRSTGGSSDRGTTRGPLRSVMNQSMKLSGG